MSPVPHAARRGFLRSACRHCLGFAALGVGGRASSQTAVPGVPEAIPGRFARPAMDSDEGGLWAIMDREEAKLRRSAFDVHDAALSAYLAGVVCRLNGEHCADMRVHVVRTPHFNASMAPNGMMQVWTGLLLRVENEAQLAAVIGHEMGHYLARHTIERLRDAKNKTAAATVFALLGPIGLVGQIGMLASLLGFSRDQERQADRYGMKLLRDAGYDGTQAALVWDNLLGELKVTGGEDVGKRSPMFATHPPVADRRDELIRLAGDAGGYTGAEELRRAIAPHRLEWLKDEVRRGQYEESLVLFGRMLTKEPADAQVLFARGEAYRLRGQQGDLDLALADLSRAAAIEGAPAEAFRGLGLVHRRRSDAAAANAAFDKYLAIAPESPDAPLIKTYLTESKP